MDQKPANSRFSDAPSLGNGTGTSVGDDLDRNDPEFLEKLAAEAGFTITRVDAD